MASRTQWNRMLAFSLVLLAYISQCLGLDLSYCSYDNTGSSFVAVYDMFQTSDACVNICKASYAYAVVSGPNCWCSNYTPTTSTTTSDCDIPCPGYGSEWCGNAATGLYAYVLISGHTTPGFAPASTASQAPYSSVSTSPTSSPRSSSTFFSGLSSLTVIATPQRTRTSSSVVASSSSTATEATFTPATSYTTSVVQSSTSAVAATSSTLTTSSIPPTSTTPTPTEVYTSVTTVTGQVRTIIVTPTSPPDSTLGSNSASGGGGGVSAGKVAGIVVGVALGLGILIGLGVWFWFRRRHARNPEVAAAGEASARSGNNGVPSRQVSQMSSAGLLGRTPRIVTAGLAPGGGGGGPRSAESAQFDRRSVGTDQRLNPYAIYAHEESRNSNVSLQDNQDYSRQLRVANPDP